MISTTPMRHPARTFFGALAASVFSMTSPLHSQPRAFDHAGFNSLLGKHVSAGLVDYDAFVSADFNRYLSQLRAFDPAVLPRAEELAFWINAYNAYTIALINKHRERKSIRNINKTAGLIKAYGPWTEKIANVGGRDYSLDEIEQDIVRPRFKDARVHFALVCAALGCPPLRSEAYTGSRLDEQLDDQARVFLLQSPSKNRVDVAKRTVYLSPIFVEFRDYINDFGGSHQSVGQYVARFFPAGPERELLSGGKFKLQITKYDWALNAQTNQKR
ncbi:MAG: DUF547 domain-containing protein [Phycisphaerae bacterium]|nr:DUF547 domain-containing protein [Gemmatimonadaceae bacterium]